MHFILYLNLWKLIHFNNLSLCNLMQIFQSRSMNVIRLCKQFTVAK